MNDAQLLLACPSCHGMNRVPQVKLSQHPNCGHCGSPLFTGRPVDLNAKGFNNHGRRSELPILVDFWADWCGPCKMMAPALAEATKQLEPFVRVGKVDTEAEQGLAAEFGIRSIPTLIVVHNGRELTRQAGAMPAASIVQFVKQAIR